MEIFTTRFSDFLRYIQETVRRYKNVLHTSLWCSKSALLPTINIGNSSRSLTLSICLWNLANSSKLAWSATEKTRRKPSPDLMYCSRIALNSSWPAVSKTKMKNLWYLFNHSEKGLQVVVALASDCKCDSCSEFNFHSGEWGIFVLLLR